mgnify:CR=1 FL=1
MLFRSLATNQWIYVAATRTGPVGTTGNMKIYAFSSGGTASGSAGTSLTTTVRSDYDVTDTIRTTDPAAVAAEIRRI